MARRGRGRGWLAKSLGGVALGLSPSVVPLLAQEAAPIDPSYSATTAPDILDEAIAGSSFSECGCETVCSPCAPTWCDPVCRVPNFFGSFFGDGIRTGIPANETLTFTGGGEGEVVNNDTLVVIGPSTVFGGFDGPFDGPGGPYTLTTDVTANAAGGPPFAAFENNQLTSLVQVNFPGAQFLNGSVTPVFDDEPFFGNDIVFNYLYNNGQGTFVSLPNPAGGGLVGRNKYFENGSPIPRDRVYFFYNHLGNFQGMGNSFGINRYVLGYEEAFLDNCFSLEVRVPFASTASSDQVAGQGMAVDNAEFGNIGLALKACLYRNANFLSSAGLGLSLPTADDSQMLVAGAPAVVIENKTCLLQPMFGFVWAPDDRSYAQFGMQVDIDPSGNPVQVVSAGGGLAQAGVYTDQAYGYVSGAAGHWIYGNPQGNLTGVALQAELNSDFSFGHQDAIVTDAVTVTDLTRSINPLNGTIGTILRFHERTNLSAGIQFPLTGDRQYDWNLIAQLNVFLRGGGAYRR